MRETRHQERQKRASFAELTQARLRSQSPSWNVRADCTGPAAHSGGPWGRNWRIYRNRAWSRASLSPVPWQGHAKLIPVILMRSLGAA